MKSKLKSLLIAGFGIGIAFSLLSTQHTSAFDLFGNPCSKATAKDSSVCASSTDAQHDTSHDNVVLRTINTAANIIAVVAGLIAVIMIIIAGFSYTTAGGNAEQTKTARNRILYAAVGLAIIALSWTITRFITDSVL
jgi:hypothetical protein